jgi:hypothetical protein
MKASKKFFFEKKNQKTFSPAGVWTGIAFNRHLWCRLKALPVPSPQEQKFFGYPGRGAFFQKSNCFLPRLAWRKKPC